LSGWRNSFIPTHIFAFLGVSILCSKEEFKSAEKKLKTHLHPDRLNEEDIILNKEVKEAFDHLETAINEMENIERSGKLEEWKEKLMEDETDFKSWYFKQRNLCSEETDDWPKYLFPIKNFRITPGAPEYWFKQSSAGECIMKVKTKEQMQEILKIKECKIQRIKENIRCYKNDERNEFCSEKKRDARSKAIKSERDEYQEIQERNDIEDWIKLMKLMDKYGIIEWDFFDKEAQIALMKDPMPSLVDLKNLKTVVTEDESERNLRKRSERRMNQLRTIDRLTFLEQGVVKESKTYKEDKENLEVILESIKQDNEKMEEDNIILLDQVDKLEKELKIEKENNEQDQYLRTKTLETMEDEKDKIMSKLLHLETDFEYSLLKENLEDAQNDERYARKALQDSEIELRKLQDDLKRQEKEFNLKLEEAGEYRKHQENLMKNKDQALSEATKQKNDFEDLSAVQEENLMELRRRNRDLEVKMQEMQDQLKSQAREEEVKLSMMQKDQEPHAQEEEVEGFFDCPELESTDQKRRRVIEEELEDGAYMDYEEFEDLADYEDTIEKEGSESSKAQAENQEVQDSKTPKNLTIYEMEKEKKKLEGKQDLASRIQYQNLELLIKNEVNKKKQSRKEKQNINKHGGIDRVGNQHQHKRENWRNISRPRSSRPRMDDYNWWLREDDYQSRNW